MNHSYDSQYTIAIATCMPSLFYLIIASCYIFFEGKSSGNLIKLDTFLHSQRMGMGKKYARPYLWHELTVIDCFFVF